MGDATDLCQCGRWQGCHHEFARFSTLFARDFPFGTISLESLMELRSNTMTVTFRQSFCLPGHDAPFPAGTYEVLSEDERLDGLTFEAFRRVATFLRITGNGASSGRTELQPVSQQDLDAALLADQGKRPVGPTDEGSLRKEER